ncbi:DUF4313 domain-containing protein [Candidatus Ornithobacterium hominis]|uniref:hypothetical protein n=1 Tax=Candidatus Ornithobacterium hominis TaxID=2497989 RepID=UPI0024BD1E6A|nr:hypothetical protein [Candidatus Ornithobacterium hominis]CAI9429696.1 DUF4313 domain-containing protein [Candidatus Ornithobacterium hominis]
MNSRRDIQVDALGELIFRNGDFLIEESDMQHVEHIVIAQPGEYKQHPTLGFGVQNYLKTNTKPVRFKRDLRIQLNYDGYQSPNIDFEPDYKNLKIEV